MIATLLGTGLFTAASVTVVAVLGLGGERARRPMAWRGAAITVGCVALLACVWWFGFAAVVGALVVVAAVTSVARALLPDFSRYGRLVLVGLGALAVVSLPWALWFVLTLPISAITRVLLLGAMVPGVALAPVAAVRTFENWEGLCRRTWRRPRTPPTAGERTGPWPRVSIHVPTHAAPPEVVIATLDALARLDYENYEVIVLDNNTTDPALWRPVAEHCELLGERFRFHHVEGLTGAKAGALNLALRLTDPNADLVAVVDADYQADPRFLADLVPFFDDPEMGFVQSPHAYRDWEGSRFLRMCNWEYGYFFATDMVSMNERNAGLTVGTMCVIRRVALERAGGWAEWCLTEDSELAIRIQALGYQSVYVNTVYGRGLIPSTFAGYRKQRFRWTYGPVQELQRHWRLFLPGKRRAPSRLTRAQRVHHAVHGLYALVLLLNALTPPLGALVVTSLAAHGESLPLPVELWAVMAGSLVTSVLQRYLVYRDMGAGVLDFLGAYLASTALAVVMVMATATAFLRRPVPWQRTDKFLRRGSGARALSAVRTELTLAAVLASVATALGVFEPFSGLPGVVVVGLALQAVTALAGPVLTLVAERDLARPRTLPAVMARSGPLERT